MKKLIEASEQSETWLRCNVGPGQFSHEYSVNGNTSDGEGFSLFTPAETVRDDGDGSGWLRVVELDRRDGLVLVQLPKQSLESGSTITVSENDLACMTWAE